VREMHILTTQSLLTSLLPAVPDCINPAGTIANGGVVARSDDFPETEPRFEHVQCLDPWARDQRQLLQRKTHCILKADGALKRTESERLHIANQRSVFEKINSWPF
jgi:hypothetical protein